MPRIPGPINPDYICRLLAERLEIDPPARKTAVIASFVQVAALCPDRLGRDSLLLAMRTLGVPREGDVPPVAARRATCAAIAAALEWQPGEMNAAYDALPPASADNGYAVDGGASGLRRSGFRSRSTHGPTPTTPGNGRWLPRQPANWKRSATLSTTSPAA